MRTALSSCLLAAACGLLHCLALGEAIPHILHQSWKDAHVPERFERWTSTWKALHPEWEYRCALLCLSAERGCRGTSLVSMSL